MNDETTLTSKGKGSVEAAIVVEDCKEKVILKKVLLLFELYCNLIPVSACKENGINVMFQLKNSGRRICIAEHWSF